MGSIIMIEASNYVRLPLNNGEKVVGFWLVITGGGVELVPRVASTGGQ